MNKTAVLKYNLVESHVAKKDWGKKSGIGAHFQTIFPSKYIDNLEYKNLELSKHFCSGQKFYLSVLQCLKKKGCP